MKPLSVAERESLVAKVVTSGVLDKAEASEMSDDGLTAMCELLDSPDGLLDPDTGYMDSDDMTETEKMRRGLPQNGSQKPTIPEGHPPTG